MDDVPAYGLGGATQTVRLTAMVSGRVQGVGFRDYVRSRARRLGLVGSATNLADGRVEVVAEGGEESCRALLDMLVTGHTPGWTESVEHVWSTPTGGLDGFVRR
jgi:acylphosphatase